MDASSEDAKPVGVPFLLRSKQQLHAEADAEERLAGGRRMLKDRRYPELPQSMHGGAGGADPREHHGVRPGDDRGVGRDDDLGAGRFERAADRAQVSGAVVDHGDARGGGH